MARELNDALQQFTGGIAYATPAEFQHAMQQKAEAARVTAAAAPEAVDAAELAQLRTDARLWRRLMFIQALPMKVRIQAALPFVCQRLQQDLSPEEAARAVDSAAVNC